MPLPPTVPDRLDALPPDTPPAEASTPEPPPTLRRPFRWLAVALLLAVVGFGLAGVRMNAGVEATYARQAQFVARAEAAFTAIPLLGDDEIARLRRSRNARHVALAESLGVGPPETRSEVDSLARRYDLVTLDRDSLYTVLPGQYSVPILTPSGAASLDSVAARFRDKLEAQGLPPFRFSVSSVWRTVADQAALRGGNVNAAAGHSSHEYATTYDLTYNPTRYSPAPDALPPPPPIDARVPAVLHDRVRASMTRRMTADLERLAADYPSRLTALLGRALIELEDEGVLVVVRERRQPVFHVTVARRLVPRP